MATTGFAPVAVAPAQGATFHPEADERTPTPGVAVPVAFFMAFPAGLASVARPTGLWAMSQVEDPETGDSSEEDGELEDEDDLEDDDFDDLDDDDEFDEDDDDLDDEFDEDEEEDDFDELDDDDANDKPGENGNSGQA
jgi:hypothetical protein